MHKETPSKLALARIEKGFTQPKVAEHIGVDAVTVCRWERGISQPYLRHVKKLCDLYGKTARELGLAPLEPQEALSTPVVVGAHRVGLSSEVAENHSVEPSFEKGHLFARLFLPDIDLRLQYIMYDWLHTKPSGSYTMLRHRLSQELEDYDSMTHEPSRHNQDTDMTRRTALRHLALLPIHALGLDALGATPNWAPEDLLTHCAAGITACEQLSKGLQDDMSLAYAVLTTYLAPLKVVVEESSTHRKEASALVAQALLIKATLSVHREGPKRAVSYGKQALIYGKESGNISLQLVLLKRLAWMYACDMQERKALEMVLRAKSLFEKQQKKGTSIPHVLQSALYGGVAKYQARNGQDGEALHAIHSAREAYLASSSDDSDTAIVDDFNYSTLIMEDGLTYYHLEQYEKALEIFGQAIDLKTLAAKVPASSERVRIEIINNETLASLKSPQKNMELSVKLWTAGIQGAIDLHSEQRFNEALTAYNIMQALWPGDKRIKELRDLTRHW